MALTPVRPQPGTPVAVEGTIAGRAYSSERSCPVTRATGGCVGTDARRCRPRRGAAVRALARGGRRRATAPAVLGAVRLLGHVLVSKVPYSERLRWLRSGGSLSPSAALLWQLVPPRTFATDRLVVTALLEPWDRVAGDAYDYAVNAGDAFFAVFDGVGHDLQAGHDTALAITAIRLARREGVSDLPTLAAHADHLLTDPARPGTVRHCRAGHPRHRHRCAAIRAGRAPAATVGPPRAGRSRNLPPAADATRPTENAAGPLKVGYEQLEPGDRLLMYSDGITEARNAHGEFFGEQRLVDFTGRAELAALPAPETLRRLTAAVLAHQGGRLQDDATLLLVDCRPMPARTCSPTLP